MLTLTTRVQNRRKHLRYGSDLTDADREINRAIAMAIQICVRSDALG